MTSAEYTELLQMRQRARQVRNDLLDRGALKSSLHPLEHHIADIEATPGFRERELGTWTGK